MPTTTKFVSNSKEESVCYKVSWEETPQSIVVAAHGTGFCKEIWQVLETNLRREQRNTAFVALDFVNHGMSQKADREGWFDWEDRSRDIEAVVEDVLQIFGNVFLIGVGHSMGSTALFRLAQLNPKMFDHLVLYEPILFPKEVTMRSSRLAEASAHRRAEFSSRTEALLLYSGKSFFKRFHPEVLFAYVQGAFQVNADGVSLQLKPHLESQMYTRVNDFLFNGKELCVSTDILVGEHSMHMDSVVGSVENVKEKSTVGFYRYVADQLGDLVTLSVCKDADHFLPLCRPNEMISFITRAIRRSENSSKL